MTSEDIIYNATVHTPISVIRSGKLRQPEFQLLNVTISVRMTEANDSHSLVQFTTVYNSSSAKTDFCHLGTLTHVLEQMLEADRVNLTVEVRTSCQFRSSAQQRAGCSVDHPGGPYLAIFYRSETQTSLSGTGTSL